MSRDLTGLTDALCRAVDKYSLKSVALALQRFEDGAVPGINPTYPPTAGDLARQARVFEPADNVIPLHNGLVEIDCGSGRINLRGLTTEEQDIIIKANGRTPDGRNMAGMALEDLRAAINQPSLPLNDKRRKMPAIAVKGF